MVNQVIISDEISIRAKDQIAEFLEDLEIFLKRSEDYGIGPKNFYEKQDIDDEAEDYFDDEAQDNAGYFGPKYFDEYFDRVEGFDEAHDFDKVHGDPSYFQTLSINDEELLETLNLINFARESLRSGRNEYLIKAIQPLLELSVDGGLIDTTTSNDILEWAATINKKEIELLYEPLDPNIIIPNIIIEANDTLIRMISRYPDLLYDISPRKFEEIIADIFYTIGYHVELTARTRDGGRDIIAIQKDVDFLIKLIIECKRFSRERKVGISFVQRLLGVKFAERANKALLVTTASFTRPAKKFESEHFWDLELKDYNSVINWTNEYAKRKQQSK